MFIGAIIFLISQIGVDEKLGSYIEDVTLYNESGKAVKIKELIDRPTILTPVYYECPGICTPILNGVKDAIQKLNFNPGIDYKIITFSFNEKENYKLAYEKKLSYTKNINPDGWIFLTGDRKNIMKLTDSIGFKFIKEGDEFIHPGVVVFLDKNGKIIRYLYGTSYLPFDFRMALIEASNGKVGQRINRLLKLCYKYEPESKKYAFDFLKVSGAIMLIAVAGFAVIMFKK